MAPATDRTDPQRAGAEAGGAPDRCAGNPLAADAWQAPAAAAPRAEPRSVLGPHPTGIIPAAPLSPPATGTAAVVAAALPSDQPLPAPPTAAAARPRPWMAEVGAPPAPAPRPDEAAHQQRLRHSRGGPHGRRPAGPRDPSWQIPQRRLEQGIRGDAATWAEHLRGADVSLTETAALLRLPPRTLRQWRRDAHGPPVEPPGLGRPYVRCTAEQGTQIVTFLNGHGPWVGLPTLRAEFTDVPRAELRDLLAVYRYLWSVQHPRALQVLHWLQAGTVWAMDFTELTQPIDGAWRYVLAVRDLASGQQLAWRPVADVTAAPVLAELAVLFTIHGAPLVVKSDNGSAFRAGAVKGLYRRWQVWPLYSPPGRPGYNGAIEASIGALKKRTQHLAERHGHPDGWTSADLEAARDLANQTTRPLGPQGATPAQAWEARRAVTMSAREEFGARVRALEEQARWRANLAPDAELTHYEHAALHRGVLQQALVESGLLCITRRRIAQRFFGQKVATIW